MDGDANSSTFTFTLAANDAPIAHAGADQTVAASATVTLDGSASSDPNSNALTYAWSEITTSGVLLTNASSESASFVAPSRTSNTILNFRLTVSDGLLSSTDEIQVTVRANQPPSAKISAPSTAQAGDTVTLNASGSTDPEGQALTYSWTQVSGFLVSLMNTDTDQASFTAALITGMDQTLTFRVSVSDGTAEDTADVSIILTATASVPISKNQTSLIIEWYDKDRTLISEEESSATRAGDIGLAWLRFDALFNAPINAVEAKFKFIGEKPAESTGNTVYMAAPYIRHIVEEDLLAPNSVTTDKIVSDAITNAELGTNAVDTINMVADAVTNAKVADNAIAKDNIVANTITAGQIAAGTITANEILSSTITASQIAASTITSDKIAANTIEASNIAASTITASELAADSVTASKIKAETIKASHMVANTITAGQIAAGAISATEIALGGVDGTRIKAGSIATTHLGANVVTADKILLGSGFITGLNGSISVKAQSFSVTVADASLTLTSRGLKVNIGASRVLGLTSSGLDIVGTISATHIDSDVFNVSILYNSSTGVRVADGVSPDVTLNLTHGALSTYDTLEFIVYITGFRTYGTTGMPTASIPERFAYTAGRGDNQNMVVKVTKKDSSTKLGLQSVITGLDGKVHAIIGIRNPT